MHLVNAKQNQQTQRLLGLQRQLVPALRLITVLVLLMELRLNMLNSGNSSFK